MKKSKKIEYFLFILLLFLQNFALITTNEFGINGLVCFLFVLTLINARKFYFKFEKKIFILIITAIIFLFLSSVINDTFFVGQIFRYIMMIWLMYMSNSYIKNVFKEGYGEYFLKIYTNLLLIFLMYGIYELIANIYSLPLYLNVFGNNPSYEVKTLYRYYGGWVDKTRLYNAFFEPSVFSVFLVYNFFFIKEIRSISGLKRKILYGLIIFNLIFTYARTGYVTMIYMIAIYILYNKILKNKKSIPVVDFIVLLIPFINLAIMYFVGLNMFDDLSSLARTYSPIYYLSQSLTDIKYILFGHSTGSIVNVDMNELYIQGQAHNGYVDIIYQFGIIVFLTFFRFLYDKLKRIIEKKYLVIGVLSTFCCFASYFCVETIMVQIIIIYNYCKYENELRGE